jgi:hypothetical protein
MAFDRMTAQIIVDKLDTKAVSPKDAKEWARKTYGVILDGRTREQVARSAIRAAKATGQG